MKPFAYHSPRSIGEAVALLADPCTSARPLAGGTDLLVQLRHGLLDADLLVDLKRIPELTRIAFDPLQGLTVGAAVSCAHLCEHPDVRRLYPALVDGAGLIGGPAIQTRATVGGNLCNGAPSGDAIPALIVLGATCAIVGPAGLRRLPVAAFCTGPGETALTRGEMLVSIHVPLPVEHSGARYVRFIPRHEMDIAVAGAGAYLALEGVAPVRIVEARIALSAVAPTPLVAEAAASALIGRPPTEIAFAAAARLAQEAARPITDVRGSEAQRRHLVSVLVRRALGGAASRAKGEALSD